jgi:hypothetical protein
MYIGPEEVLKFAFFVFDKDKNGFIEKGSRGYFMHHFLVVFCLGLGFGLGVRIKVKVRVRIRFRVRVRVRVRIRIRIRFRIRFRVWVRVRVRFITSYWYFMANVCKQRSLTN